MKQKSDHQKKVEAARQRFRDEMGKLRQAEMAGRKSQEQIDQERAAAQAETRRKLGLQ